MMNLMRSGYSRAGLAVLALSVSGCSSDAPPWASVNQSVIDQAKVTGRTRELPAVSVPMVLADGEPVEADKLPTVTIAPGVTAKLAWGRGALLERVEMQADAVYPEQTLGEELIIIGQDGSATVEFDGKTAELKKDQALYLQPGAKRSVKAGSNGWKAFEVYSPVRLDHLALAGQNTSGVNATFPDQGVTPSLQPGVVVNLSEIPWTPLTDPVAGNSYRRAAALSQLLWGKNAQISLVRMDPGSEFPLHIHPEDQLTHTVRGTLDQGVMDKSFAFSAAAGNTIYLPSGMVHSAKLGDMGADQLDVFWPVRPDYLERAQKQRELFEQIVAPDAKPQKLAEGFTFTEGPTWLKGKLYFSDMYFKNPAAGDWTGSPARSRLIVMEPDGKWRVLSSGMQSNGTIAAKNGNLIVCDMFGHRVVEVDPATGRVVRVLLDKIDGKPIDGPNDLVMDAKGGLYITDPQFTPEAQEEPAGQAGVLRSARWHREGGDRSRRIRHAERRRTFTRRQNALCKQYVVAARRKLRVGIRRGGRRVALEQAAVCEAGLDAGSTGRRKACGPFRFRRRWRGCGYRWPLLCRHQKRRPDLSAGRHVGGHDLCTAVSRQHHFWRREQ